MPTDPKLSDAISAVVERASKDADFRALAVSNSAKAIAQVSSVAIPPGTNIKFVDNSGSTHTVVLGDPVFVDDLSDMELEQVAGGRALDTISVTWTR